jgi:hypothetical protein
MKCELCGRQYIALGVHLRHRHAVDPDDYREEFGILRTTPLVDEDLSAQLSAGAKRRLQDDEYKAEVQARCRDNADANKGKPAPGMTRAGKAALAKRNAEANAEYLRQQAPKVAKVLREKKTMLDVRRDLGMGREAAKKIVAMGEAAYSKEVAAVVATQRRVASRLRNRGA